MTPGYCSVEIQNFNSIPSWYPGIIPWLQNVLNFKISTLQHIKILENLAENQGLKQPVNMSYLHEKFFQLHFTLREKGTHVAFVNTYDCNALVYPLSAFSVSTNLLPLHAIKCKRIRAANIWLPNNGPLLVRSMFGLDFIFFLASSSRNFIEYDAH
ncbi:hypothetical protein ACFE04_019388 [Oxalis oulophora]